jgi:hypothetical protein
LEKVTGVGAVYFRAYDSDSLADWYAAHLGVAPGLARRLWWQDAGPTSWEPFPADADFVGVGERTWMVNFRVRDLDAMLTQLRRAGAAVDAQIRVEDGVGRFGWVTDPEGNRVELWEPAPELLT